MHIATISSKRQITLPKKLLDKHNVKPGDTVVVTTNKNGLAIEPKTNSIVEETAGSLKKYIPKAKLGVPFKQVREKTMQMVAEEIAKEGLP